MNVMESDKMDEIQPPSIPDDVYPLHAMDNNPNYVDWVMRFNDALDAQMLKDSLSRLLEIGNWRKFGGRFRYNSNGKLEIHVPGSSAGDRENVSFTHNIVDSSIQDHPVARNLPVRTDGPSLHLLSTNFRPFIARPNFPKFEELTRHDIPPISVHVTSFNNATIVALAWPHHLMDAMGGKALLAAWSSVLAGQEDEVPEVVGAREDILQHPEIAAEDDEEFILEKSRLTGGTLLMFHLRFLWDSLWNGSREKRVIFLPKASFEKMKARAQQEISASAPNTYPAPFASENDILTAWITRAFASSEPNSRPITVLNLLNLRFRIPLLFRSTGVFIQNICIGTYTFLSSRVAQGPVGQIALVNRQHTAEQGTDKQARKLLRSLVQDTEAGRSPRILFGPTDGLFLVVNNVIKIELMKTANFAPAVLRQGEESGTRSNPLGTMVSYFNESLDHMYDYFNAFLIFGKDHADNYWLGGALLPRAWKVMEEELRKL
ncbi:hypothetical protein VN97_g5754 [Penicillium thymicola]|uniref:Uncharacterized protein n=1 Tax=Penicillium thymicola TaxID=293382 RepID=A0AAI9TI63_PENTH|nr:hypothetical protein VN97_g5754 [Penicillium thymicola]